MLSNRNNFYTMDTIEIRCISSYRRTFVGFFIDCKTDGTTYYIFILLHKIGFHSFSFDLHGGIYDVSVYSNRTVLFEKYQGIIKHYDKIEQMSKFA